MYEEKILELYERRPNFGKLDSKTHELKHSNPICNDEITLELNVKEGKIIDAKFHGISCFISVVSAAALTENIKGIKVEDAKKLTKKDIDGFLGINVIPTRINCELLPLEALKKIKC